MDAYVSKPSRQKGIALFLTLIFILILSVLGVSIIFVSQSETWSGLNYLEMTQARYGAESGMNAAANYIINTYCAPGNASACTNGNSAASGDTISLYNTNVSPVTLVSSGAAVTLSTTSGASTYPVASVVSAFQSAAAGSVADGNRSVNYTATATLMAMNSVTTAAGTQTVQTWDLVGTGTTGDIRAATVTVDGIVEQQVTFAAVSAPSYGVFATGTACDAVNLSNGVTIGSYNSKGATSFAALKYGGNVGSNGNMTAVGGSTVNGTFSTPRSGVSTTGSCSSSAPNALDYNNGAVITECGTAAPVSPATTCGSSPTLLSQNVTYATPTLTPSTAPTFNTTAVNVTSSTTCAQLISAVPSITACSGSAGNLTATSASLNMGPLTINNGGKLALNLSGTANINSINNQSTLTITPSTGAGVTILTNSISLSNGDTTTLTNTSPITFNIYGTAGVDLQGGTALTFSGGGSVITMNIAASVTQPFNLGNGSFSNVDSAGVPVPAMFQVNYAGTSTITLEGGTKDAAAIYAPSAPISFSNGSTWYGSVIGSTITDTGGTSIYYDQAESSSTAGSSIATVQQFMMDSFSWTRF